MLRYLVADDTQSAQVFQVTQAPALIDCHYMICMKVDTGEIAVTAV